MEGEKRCSRCREVKPFSEFYHDYSRKTTYARRCKKCIALIARNSYTATKQRMSREKEVLKYEAHKIISNGLAMGKITKEPCFLCGETKVDGHHIDYSYPEKVIWLCSKHHAVAHNGYHRDPIPLQVSQEPNV